MKLLLDTHILLWTLADDPRLSEKAREWIENADAEIYYSVISPCETEIKYSVHPEMIRISGNELTRYCDEAGFHCLPVASRHVRVLSSLKRRENAQEHKDPFDRMMISQAKADGMLFLTHDRLLSGYDEACIVMV